MVANRSGNTGANFSLLNRDSEYGLSLLTLGRECDFVTSTSDSHAATVLDVSDVPRSAWTTSGMAWWQRAPGSPGPGWVARRRRSVTLPVLREYSVDRRDRADIDAIIEQAGVDLERRKIHNIGRVHDAQSPGVL